MSSATLFIVATPIGNLSEVSERTLDTLRGVDIVAAEDTRNTRKLLSHFDIHTKMMTYHNFNEKEAAEPILVHLRSGENVALVSDAGYPLISDPGYVLVNRVIEEGFKITVVSGPNAAITGLVASGLETAHYLYYGFLNSKTSAAKKELEALKDFPYTMIFYEAPHRITKTLKICLEVLGDRKACVARELTKVHEEYLRGTLSELSNLENIRGEIVLIIEGNHETKEETNTEDLLDEVEELIAQGLRTKEAVREIAEKYKVSKNDLYDNYIHR